MSQITSSDRILKTIAGEKVDRIPIWAPITWNPIAALPPKGHWQHDPLYQELVEIVANSCDFLVNMSVAENPLITKGVVQAASPNPGGKNANISIFDSRFFLVSLEHINVLQSVDANNRKIFEYNIKTPKGIIRSVEALMPQVDTVWRLEPFVKNTEDAKLLLSIPSEFYPPDPAPFFEERERLGSRGVPFVMIHSPLAIVIQCLGFQRFLEWTILETELIEEMMVQAARRVEERLDWALANGIGPIFRFEGTEQATPPMQSPKAFQRFVMAYEAPLWRKVRQAGKIVAVHCHGKIKTVIDSFVDNGVQMLDPVEPPPDGNIEIEEAKEISLRGPMTLVGNIQYNSFYSCTTNEITSLVKRAIGTGDKRYLILAPSDFAIAPINIRFRENVEAYIRAGLEFGQIN